MRNNKSRLVELCNDYDLQITLTDSGAIVFYKNTMESDVIAFSEDVTQNYFLEKFEMVMDLSKLQLNMHQNAY
jgi:hypothetical protein